MQLIMKEFATYKSECYKICIDGEERELDAFLISFANASQWGNNVHIAPGALIDDGLIDVCMIKDFPKVIAPALLISLLDPSIDRSKFDIVKLGKHIIIEHNKPLLGHVDGEPVNFGNKLDVEIIPHALNVMIPSEEFLKKQNIFGQLNEQWNDLIPNIQAQANKLRLKKICGN